MNLFEIVKELDNEFNIESYMDVWGRFDYYFEPLKPYLSNDFMIRYSGLMINNSKEIELIIGATFLSQSLFEYIIQKDIHNALVFTHHPLYQKVSDYSWEDKLIIYASILKDRKISIYSCHLPFDEHRRYSTSYYMANSFLKEIEEDVTDEEGFLIGFKGLAKDNIIDLINDISSEIMVYNQDDEIPNKVICVPGGGLNTNFLRIAKKYGIDTYITGSARYKGKNAEMRNYELIKTIEELDIKVICFGHYESERIGVKRFINEYFDNSKIKTIYFEDSSFSVQ